MSEHDEAARVLIAGAGPTGLTTAILLGMRGVPALVVERHAGTAPYPRARGIAGPAMRVFGEAGVDAAVREAGRVLAPNRLMLTVDTLAGAEIARERLASVVEAADDRVFEGFTLCPQNLLEPVLVGRAREVGADVRFGVELTGFEADATGVTAYLGPRRPGDGSAPAGPGERRAVRAAYLVGADGTRGRVRGLAGIGADGPGRLGRHVNVVFRADLTDLVRGREFLFCFARTPASPGFFAPVDNVARWQFNVTLDDGDDPAAYTPARCADLVRAAAGVAGLDVEVERIMHWGPGLRVAESLHRGRVALAGDAAHELPAGGLGAGVGDAAVLAPYLLEAVRGAGPDALARYTVARLPVVREMADRLYANAGRSGLPT